MNLFDVRRRLMGIGSGKRWLYRDGSQYNAFSGGWAATLAKDGNVGTVTAQAGYLEIYNKSTAGLTATRRTAAVSQSAVPFAGYSRIGVEFSSSTTSNKAKMRIALYTSKTKAITSYSYVTGDFVAPTANTRHTIYFDVSGLQNQSLFIAALWTLEINSSSGATAKIYRIWLEK